MRQVASSFLFSFAAKVFYAIIFICVRVCPSLWKSWICQMLARSFVILFYSLSQLLLTWLRIFIQSQLPLEPCKLLKIVAWVWRWVVEVINLSGVTTWAFGDYFPAPVLRFSQREIMLTAPKRMLDTHTDTLISIYIYIKYIRWRDRCASKCVGVGKRTMMWHAHVWSN